MGNGNIFEAQKQALKDVAKRIDKLVSELKRLNNSKND